MRRAFSIALLMLLSVLLCLTSSRDPFGVRFVLGCPNSEREALLKFKHSLTDPANRLSSWKGDDCCHWLGVGCHNLTRHVHTLDLRNDEDELVAQNLNPSLGELRQLRYLDLSSNNFNWSQIPEFIGSMKHLRYLNLSYACFGGVVPSSLGNLTRLRALDLANGGLNVDNLHWVSGLQKLESLDMSEVNLTNAKESVEALSKLPSLLDLRLSGNFDGWIQLCCGNSTLAHVFLNSTWLSSLEHFDLSYNRFGGPLPRFFGNMTSLRYLDLFENYFNGSIPLWFSNMRSLDSIYLSENYFSHVEGGTIMGIMGNPCNLKLLHLSSNQDLQGEIVGPHDNFSRCNTYELESLDLNGNRLTGSLSKWLGKLSNLKYLYLGENMFNEVVLSEMHLANLSSLEELDLSFTPLKPNTTSDFLPSFQLTKLNLRSCKMEGQIPQWIGMQNELVSLDLSSNMLKGTVSNYHLAGLSSLGILDLSYNSLSFNFSSDWTPPFHLIELDMRSSGIQGELFQWIQTQTYLQFLDLSNNMISGKLLDWSQNIKLIELNLSHNSLEGLITHFPSGILSIDLSHNLLTGSLSQDLSTNSDKVGTSLCQLSELEFLNLQSNRISGTIPHGCWRNSSYLYTINLSSNKLSGIIPMTIGVISRLTFLNLNNNSLEGQIPPTFSTSGDLQILDLGENKISGKVPSFGVKSHPFLQILRLRANQLGGGIPTELCSLPVLQILDLASNNLTGNIPRCLGQLNGMAVVAPIGLYDLQLIPLFWEYPDEENTMEVLKGQELQYTTTLKFVENLDLSCNALVGSIPEELTNLSTLIGLNLSYNHLIGKIPEKIGQMRSLESLDLSKNNLSGTIPSSLSSLISLEYLNLSHNKLHGEIPTGQQLQTLNDPSIYAGNLGLCGDPLPNKCTRDQGQQPGQKQEPEQEEEDRRETILFYLVVALGFGTGFWGVVGTLVLKKKWRNALFQLVEDIVDYIYVRVAVMINRMNVTISEPYVF